MPYTTHGHWYGEGKPTLPGPRLVAKCSAFGACEKCRVEAGMTPFPPQRGAPERVTDIPDSCVFCDILAGDAPATIVRTWSNAIAIKPLNPVAEGHTLVIPATHVRDAIDNPQMTAETMAAAAEYAAGVGPCNIITSVGREATQSVFHLHLHVVPRRAGDGLALPWTGIPPRTSGIAELFAPPTLPTRRFIAEHGEPDA